MFDPATNQYRIGPTPVGGGPAPISGERSLSLNSGMFSPVSFNNPTFHTAHQRHAWTYSVMKARAMAVGSVPVRIYTGQRSNKVAVPDNHPLQKLFGAPNQAYSESVFWRLLIGMMDRKGYGMIVLDPVANGGEVTEFHGGIPKEMWVLDPDDFWVNVKDASGRLTKVDPYAGLFKDLWRVDSWQHKTNKAWKFSNDQVIFQEYPEGAPLTAARLSIEGDFAAANYSKRFVENDCVPSGWFEVDQHMRDEEYRQFKERMAQDHAGSENAGKHMLLDGGIKWTPNPVTSRDMQWLEGRAWWLDEICAVFGTPKAILNIGGDAKYSNHISEQRVFMENTIFPIARDIMDAFWSQFFIKVEGGKYWGEFDASGHPALQSDLDDRANVGKTFVAMGYSLNAVNDRLNLGFEEVDGGDVGLVNASLVPLDEVSLDDSDSILPPAPEADELSPDQVTAILAIVAQVQAGTLPAESAKEALSLGYQLTESQINSLIDPASTVEKTTTPNNKSDVEPLDQPDNEGRCVAVSPTDGHVSRTVRGRRLLLSAINERAALLKRGMNNAEKYIRRFRLREVAKREKRFASRMTKMFMDQKREVIKSFEAVVDGGRSRGLVWNEAFGKVDRETGERAPSALSADDLVKVKFDEAKWNAELDRLFNPIYTDMIDATGRSTLALSPGAPLSFDIANPKWTEIINGRVGDYLVAVNKETTGLVRKAMRTALSKGETPVEMKARLRTLHGFSRARAKTVAITEMGSVINETRRAQFEQFEVEKIVWITQASDEPREEHQDNANQEAVIYGEPFSNGMRWPHDDNFGADQIIRCGCDIMVPLSDKALADVADFAAEE